MITLNLARPVTPCFDDQEYEDCLEDVRLVPSKNKRVKTPCWLAEFNYNGVYRRHVKRLLGKRPRGSHVHHRCCNGRLSCIRPDHVLVVNAVQHVKLDRRDGCHRRKLAKTPEQRRAQAVKAINTRWARVKAAQKESQVLP